MQTPSRSRWRTGDLPAPLLALAYLLVVAAVLALASTGSSLAVVAIAVLMGLVAATLYLWSDTP